MIYTNRREEAIEKLIQNLLTGGFGIAQTVTASSLRKRPGLTVNEKYLAAKREIMASWPHRPANAEQILESAVEHKTTDELIDFAISSISLDTAINILEAFGTEDSETVMRLVTLLKESNRGTIFLALKAIKSDSAPKQAIDFVVEWAVEENDANSAIKAATLREEPGLYQFEVETLLEKRKKQGDVIRSIILADMLETPGLTTADIEDLAAAITT